MKYEFKKNGTDDYSLIYKDKEIKFKSDVDTANKMQEVEAEAKIKMIQDLADKGKSIRNLTIEFVKDGKKYYDNTNRIEMEKAYIEKEQAKVFGEIIEKTLNIKLEVLFEEIGFTEEKEVQDFSIELAKILTGQWKSPSGEVLSKETETK